MLVELCKEIDSTPWAQVGMRWREQAYIDLAEARETAATAEVEVDEDGME